MPRTVAMIFALRALFAPASPAIEAPNPATPQPEIVRVANAYVKAMLASDAALVAALYQEDAVEMPNCRPLVKGRAEIEQVLSWPHEGGEDHQLRAHAHGSRPSRATRRTTWAPTHNVCRLVTESLTTRASTS